MQTYDFTLTAGGVQTIQSVGKYFRYMAASASGGDEAIKVTRGNGGQTVILRPGQAVRYESDNTDWFVTADRGGAMTGRVAIGDGRIDDSRIVGEVSVIDGGRARTQAGRAFSNAMTIAAVAAQYSYLQLWNPSGSGKVVIVEAVTASSNVANPAVAMRGASAALATLIGNAETKLIGGAKSAAELRKENSAANLGIGQTLYQWGLTQGVSQRVPMVEPVAIMPGYGLMLYSAVLNQDVAGTFEFFEESLT